MSQLLLKIQRNLFILVLVLFALSSNRHAVGFFVDSYKTDFVVALDEENAENEVPEKTESEKKDSNEYFSFLFEFSFSNLIDQQVESLHLENSKLHILIPSSPPPEQVS